MGYLLLNIFGPIIVLVLGLALSSMLSDTAGLLVCIAVYAFAVFWWALLSRKHFDRIKSKTLARLEENGFTPNYTFNGSGCTISVDLHRGQVAFVFRWNPRKAYIRPASALSKLRVDDGRHGAGFLAGSSRVSFLFTVDGAKFRIDTFTSNRRWKMDSEYITTGVDKANTMVKSLIAAGAKA